MAIDEIFTLLESLQRSGRVPAPNLFGRASSALEGSGNPALSALKTIGSGLTLAPVIKGLLRLFSGDDKKRELPAIQKFELPAPIRTEIGLSQNGESFAVERGAGDRVRRVGDAATTPLASPMARPTQAAITVNVQAMDSQSFLDRRDDIARAVREAMLHSHNVNDVVNEI